ncbi:IS256 family transposase [bacterium]
MIIKEEILEELLKDCTSPEDLMGKNGLVKQLTKSLIEKALDGEITHHLGHSRHSKSGGKKTNYRNGSNSKNLRTNLGEIEIESPRDRNGTFEPKLVEKRQTKFKEFDNKIISMYARGMSNRDIEEHLKDIYGVEVSAQFITNVTDSVIEEVVAWQNRPLDEVYPIMYMDALRIKTRENGHIINKALYLAMGVNLEGHKEVLGMWLAKTEGAKFWLNVITELKNRGVNDIFIACVDGLTGFEDAIHSIYPETEVQLCIVHMIRNSLKYVPYKDRKKLSTDLKKVYTTTNADSARLALEDFKEKWDSKYPTIYEIWNRNWEGIIPFLAYPEYIRKAIYTTNAIESLNHTLRKITKTKGSFPTDNAVFKLIYLGLQNASKKWTMPIRDWKLALNQFAIIFEGRFPLT